MTVNAFIRVLGDWVGRWNIIKPSSFRKTYKDRRVTANEHSNRGTWAPLGNANRI